MGGGSCLGGWEIRDMFSKWQRKVHVELYGKKIKIKSAIMIKEGGVKWIRNWSEKNKAP